VSVRGEFRSPPARRSKGQGSTAGEDCLSRGPTLRAAPALALPHRVAVTASELSVFVDELGAQPAVRRIVVGGGVPVDVHVDARHVERQRHDAVLEPAVDRARVALGHGQEEIGAIDDRASGVVVVAAQTHASLETHGGIAEGDGDKLLLHISTQSINASRDSIADALRVPRPNVRVFTEYMGGGFGSKLTADVQVIIAARLRFTIGSCATSVCRIVDEFNAEVNKEGTAAKSGLLKQALLKPRRSR